MNTQYYLSFSGFPEEAGNRGESARRDRELRLQDRQAGQTPLPPVLHNLQYSLLAFLQSGGGAFHLGGSQISRSEQLLITSQ